MGCVTSKILTKSASYRDEFNRRLQKRSNSLDEIIISKNGSEQFLALLSTANVVARKLKEGSPSENPDVSKNSSTTKNADSNSNCNNKKEPERNGIETINTWELLAGLEEDNEGENQRRSDDELIKSTICYNSVGPSRSFRTVEDFDALVAASKSSNEQETHESRINNDCVKESRALRSEHASEKGSRRKAMAKDLAALKVPTFEFTKSGSLRDWLLQGGQVFSPGSYVTPKFGNFVSTGAKGEDNADVFDPELVAQFERAMEQLTVEEESILKEIIQSLESGNEECNFRTEVQENGQGLEVQSK